MKVRIFKTTVKLYPSQGAKKWVTDDRRVNYKGRVLGGIESEKQHAEYQPWRTNMNHYIGISNSLLASIRSCWKSSIITRSGVLKS